MNSDSNLKESSRPKPKSPVFTPVRIISLKPSSMALHEVVPTQLKLLLTPRANGMVQNEHLYYIHLEL